MITFCKANSLPESSWTVQIGYIAYTDVFCNGTVVLAKALKDCSGCAVQLCRIEAAYINVIDEQFAGVEINYAGEDLSQS
jgi:hypothetical protein